MFDANDLLTDWLTDWQVDAEILTDWWYKNSDWRTNTKLLTGWWLIDLRLVLGIILEVMFWLMPRVILEVILDCIMILRADRLPYIFFSNLPLPFKIHSSPKPFFQTPKSLPYPSHPPSPARLQMLHCLSNCSSSFKTGSCLLIVHGFARFPIQYSSHFNLVSSFAIWKMGSCLLILLQWHPNRNSSIQMMWLELNTVCCRDEYVCRFPCQRL